MPIKHADGSTTYKSSEPKTYLRTAQPYHAYALFPFQGAFKIVELTIHNDKVLGYSEDVEDLKTIKISKLVDILAFGRTLK